LYFSLPPILEAKRKNWTKSKKINLNIAQKLYKSTLNKIKKTKLPFVVMDEFTPSRNTFGANITQAIEQVFTAGYQHLIVVGNDCPDISIKDMLIANEHLKSSNHTIGLTKDGGSFLFTISKKTWNASAFAALPWCSNQLGTSLQVLLEKENSVAQLNMKVDIDLLRDIQYLINCLQSSFSHFLKEIFSTHTVFPYYFSTVVHLGKTTIARRGPPISTL